MLGYTGLSDALLLKYKEDSKHIYESSVDDIPIANVGATIGTYAGPGAIACAYFQK